MPAPYNNTDNPHPEGKHAGGTPPAWEDPDEVQAVIDQYFEECDKKIIVKQHAHSKGITEVETPTPYTMAGLARALKISRETLNQYKKHEKFADIIMHARAKVHEQNLTLGLVGCHDSKIAALNLASNYGYATKKDVELTDNTAIAAILESLPADQRERVEAAVKEKLRKK